MPEPAYNYYPINIEVAQLKDEPKTNTSAVATSDSNVTPSANGTIVNGGTIQSPNFSKGNAGWQLDSNGNIEANDGNFRGDITGASGSFTGNITATTGSIGGWTIGATALTSGTGATTVGLDSGGTNPALYAGSATPASAPFRVANSGQLTASNIVATGTINADGGYLASGVYLGATDALLCESTGLNAGVTGHVRGGQTDYNTGTGFFLGYSGAAYKFSVGSPTGDRLTYDGVNLKLNAYSVATIVGAAALQETFQGRFDDGLTETTTNATITRRVGNTYITITETSGLASLKSAELGTTPAGGDYSWNLDYEYGIVAELNGTIHQNIFLGLFDKAGGAPSVNATETDRHVGFYVDDGVLYASNANGTTQTKTDITSGVTLTDKNWYRIVFDSGTSAKFYVNDTLKATHTTNLPADSSGKEPIIYNYAQCPYFNKCLDLERGSSEYASIADGSQTGLDLTGDFTIEFWVNPETTTANCLINKWLNTGNKRGYQIQMNDAIIVALSSDGTASVSKSWVYAFSAGTWYHVAVVYDASEGSVDVFINGTSQTAQTGYATSIFNNDQPFEVGVLNAAGSYYDGKIDDIRVWSDIRSEAEIDANMNTELVGNEANLVAYWKFGDSLLDETTNNNDLTHSGTATYVKDNGMGEATSRSLIISNNYELKQYTV